MFWSVWNKLCVHFMLLQCFRHPVYATVQGLLQTQIVSRAEKTRHRVLKKQITFVNRKEQYSDSANSHRKNEHCLIYQDKEHTLNLTQGANLYRKTRRFSISYFVKPNMMLKVQWNESFWHCNPCETTLGCWMAWPWPSSYKWQSNSRCRNSKIFEIYFHKICCMIWRLLVTNGPGLLRSSNAVIPDLKRILCTKKSIWQGVARI